MCAMKAWSKQWIVHTVTVFECFYLPLMIPSLRNACPGSHRNTINVCLVLPNGVRGGRCFWQLVEWGSEGFTRILMWLISVLSFRNNINLYMRLHWNTWVPFSPAEGGEPPKCQTPASGRRFSPLPHQKAVTRVGRKNLSCPEQETEIAQTSLEGGDDACVCCCLLSAGTSTAS